MKKCGMRDSRKKGAGMEDQDPLPDPVFRLSGGSCNYLTSISHVYLSLSIKRRRVGMESLALP